MTGAVSAMPGYYPDRAGFFTVYASFFPENGASKRVMEKCGMTYSHTHEKEFEYPGIEGERIYYSIRAL